MTKMMDRNIRPEWFAQAKANGIKKSTLRTRLLDLDWDIEDAISLESQTKPNEWLKIAMSRGIKRGTFYGRIRKGYTPEEAVSVRFLPKKHNHERDLYEYADKAVANGINRGTFWNRIYRGADPEKACTIPARKKGGNTRHESTFI